MRSRYALIAAIFFPSPRSRFSSSASGAPVVTIVGADEGVGSIPIVSHNYPIVCSCAATWASSR